jgi:predicted nucleic-acid-binding Zn-ribbon protein
MKAYSPAQGCPKCGGQQGYSFTMTECHAMGGAWGELASSGDNGDQRFSLVSCDECGYKFQMKTLTSLGAIPGSEAACVHRFD